MGRKTRVKSIWTDSTWEYIRLFHLGNFLKLSGKEEYTNEWK
jgi:hypothetical protein